MTTQGTIPWATVAAIGNQMRIPHSPRSRGSESRVKYIPEVLYTSPEFETEIVNRRAASLVQQALTDGTVLFSFPAGMFTTHIEAYKTIRENIGPVSGFQHLSGYTPNPDKGEMLIEARFVSDDDRHKALEQGVTIGSRNFVGVATSTGAHAKNFVHVALTLLHIPAEGELLHGLQTSLQHYGTVHQIKKFTCEGFFDGKISFVIDTHSPATSAASGTTVPIQALSRQLYLSFWDKHAPASFKGAAPICFYCRQAGHVRRECPKLHSQKCYGCGMKGHTKRFCKQKQDKLQEEVEDSVLIAEYEKLKQNREVGERRDQSTEGLTQSYTGDGPEASQWAPDSAAVHMRGMDDESPSSEDMELRYEATLSQANDMDLEIPDLERGTAKPTEASVSPLSARRV